MSDEKFDWKKLTTVNHTSIDTTKHAEYCKGKKQRPHKPEWILDMTYGENIHKLRCKSCGRILGNSRVFGGDCVVNIQQFSGREKYTSGPKKRGPD